MNALYYRPEWTCGRYNPNGDVALMYNLIEGKSFFFESYSAQVIREILAVGRNGQLDIQAISDTTSVPIDSIIEFIEDVLIDVGLVVPRLFTKEEIHAMRRSWSKVSIEESPHYNLSTLKTEQVVDMQTAEMEYTKHFDVNTQISSMLLELTYNCSERCIHCYNMGATRNDDEVSGRNCLAEIGFEDYKQLIDQLDAMGCYKVCLSGGDPFSKPIAWEIIDYLYQKEIACDIFTNGLAITTKVERLIDYYPRFVGISIYSGIAEVHDRITRVKGSFERSMAVASKLSEYGVPMSFKCVVMKPNIKSYHLVKDLAKEYGAICQIEANLCMGVDGDMAMINHLRLSREEFEVLLRDKDIPLYVGLEVPNEGRIVKPSDAYPCGGGWNSFSITPSGDMVICANLQFVLGNISETSIFNILQGEAIKEWRSLTIGKLEDCGSIPKCDYCNLCVGNNYNEHGVMTRPSEVNCFMADVRYELIQKLKQGYDPLNGLSVADRLQQMADDKFEVFGKEFIKH